MSITSYNSIFSKPFPKTLILEFDDEPQTIISNDKIVQESMELEETLCSDSNLKYGCCESSCFNVRVVNNGSLKGKTFTAKLQFQSRGILINDSGDYIVNDEGSYIGTYNSSNVDTITIGKYKVYSDKPTSDRAYRDLMCYDIMYDILDVDIASWYDGLTFPMTLKTFRDSLFTFLGVTQETTTLINDNYSIKGNYQVDSLSCKDILTSICEANGVFGHINRSGKFEYISLPSVETVTLDHHINGKGGYEDFVTSAITGVECVPIDSDIGTKVGTDTNLYILENNLIFYGDEGSQEQVAALTNLLNKIKSFTYRPCSITTYGNPMMEIGTSIVDTVNDLIIESFVMSRYLSGIQAMKDEYRAYGDEKYPENVNSLKTSVKRLSGKTIKLDTEITNMGAKTVLKLTADGRIVKVALDATPSGSSVKIKADNIDFIADNLIQLTSKTLGIKSTNFEVTSAGVITAKSGTIGPWKMTTTDLYDSAADSGTGVGAGIGKNGTTMAFWAGSNYANRNSAPFRVSHSGAVNASNLTITGGSITLGTKFSVNSSGDVTASNLTATGGKIGPWTIGSGMLSATVGSYSAYLAPGYLRVVDSNWLVELGTGGILRTSAATTASRWVLNLSSPDDANSWINTYYVSKTNLGASVSTGFVHSSYISRQTAGDSNYVNFVNINNTAYAPIRVSDVTYMSCKYTKTNIKDISNDEALKLLKIKPVNFDYIEEIGGQKNRVGVLAEDTYKILPNVVSMPEDYKEENFDASKGINQPLPSVDYVKFVPYLIKLVQMQQEEIAELKSLINGGK